MREANSVVDITSHHVRQIWKNAEIAKLSISSKRRMIECAHVRALWKSAIGLDGANITGDDSINFMS